MSSKVVEDYNPFADTVSNPPPPKTRSPNPFLTSPRSPPPTLSKSTNPFETTSEVVNTNPFADAPPPVATTSANTNPFASESTTTTSATQLPLPAKPQVPPKSKTPKPQIAVSKSPIMRKEDVQALDNINPFADGSEQQNTSEARSSQTTKSVKSAQNINPFSDEAPQVNTTSYNPFGESTQPKPPQVFQETQKSKTPESINPFADAPPALGEGTTPLQTNSTNPFLDTTQVEGSNPFSDLPPAVKQTSPGLGRSIDMKSPRILRGEGMTNKPFSMTQSTPQPVRPRFSSPVEVKRKTQKNVITQENEEEWEDSWMDKSTFDISSRGIVAKNIQSSNGRVLLIGKEKHYFFMNYKPILIRNIPNHITKAAIDKTGTHMLLSTFDGKLFYVNKDLIDVVPIKIPQQADSNAKYVFTAIRFNGNESSEERLKVMVATGNRNILLLYIDVSSGSGIKTSCEVMYVNKKKMNADVAPFNAIDWIETSTSTIILASSPSCLQKIVVNTKKDIIKDESILIMPLKTEPETGYFSLVRDIYEKNIIRVMWVSGKMKGLNQVNPAESSNIVTMITFEVVGNELQQNSKKDIIKDIVAACQTQHYVFYLYNDHIECQSLLNEKKCEEILEGGAISLCADLGGEEETVFVSTGFSLYKFSIAQNVGKDDEPFNKKLLRDISDRNKLFGTLLNQLNEESKKEKQENTKISCAVLYCWCVSILLERLNVSEKVPHIMGQMKSLFSKDFEGKDIINSKIVRYMVRSCGSEEVFNVYCECSKDYEGKVGYLMERGEYSEVMKVIRGLMKSREERIVGESLMKKYFGVLFMKLGSENTNDFLEILENQESKEYPVLYSCLLMNDDKDFSIDFARQLLERKEKGKKSGNDKTVVNYIFWRYVDPLSNVRDEDVKRFLEEKGRWDSIEFESGMRALKDKRFYRTSLFMNLQKKRYESAIEDAIVLINQYDTINKEQKDEDVSLLLKLPGNITNEDEKRYYYLRAMSGYLSGVKTSGDPEQRKAIYETVMKNKIPVEDLLQLLPSDWNLGEFKEIVKNAIEVEDKKNKNLMNEVERMCGSSAKFESTTARYKKCYKTELTALKCNFCGEHIIPQKKGEFNLDGSRGAMFPCSHCFHLLCIKNEFKQHPTAFARYVTQLIINAQDEEEQFNCYAAECPICGEHSIDLIKFPYTSAQNDQYWNL
ncbi:hypothetical protein EIN_059320 [Entamoeba invadens IP1]|uniref:hypothetical protein n=1 Tax=Entamoeba invadens IP1 TaxID=370355 RepID=UPI0002C3EAB5|nr:hypothetical protein EIN_059320 [Entamoeba invadens IP1]ELP93447.1 hypothetical protein EIN_059320 [Entamoeba invadens IP1]|eukprot:XP_004260218.1 hypothetical protein EIN_059320 [Entamoeba invadens IP1]